MNALLLLLKETIFLPLKYYFLVAKTQINLIKKTIFALLNLTTQ
jgi:hypothetical protein